MHSHHDLETVEAFGLSALHFSGKSLDKVLVDDTVGLKQGTSAMSDERHGADETYSSEEGKDMFDEVSLVVVELVLPVMQIHR